MRTGGRHQLGFRTITRKVFTWFISYFGILLHITRERTLLIFGHIRPRSRSQWLKKSENMRFPDDNSKSFHLIHLILWNIVAYHTRENPIDFRPHPSKVKVTVIEKLRQNLKTWGFRMITPKRYFWFNWNLGILLFIKWVGTLLIFRKIRQRSRSQWPDNFEFFFRKRDFLARTPKVYIWFNWNFVILLLIKWVRTPLIFGKICPRPTGLVAHLYGRLKA